MAKSGIFNLKLAALEESNSFTIVFNTLRLAGDKSIVIQFLDLTIGDYKTKEAYKK